MTIDREGLVNVQPGQMVRRMLAGTIPMDVKVAAVDERFIYCGPELEEGVPPEQYPGWKFDRTYGYEVDEDLGWGTQAPGEIITGSFLEGVIIEGE